MYIVTGACDSMPYETTTHESLDDACLQMAELLGCGYVIDDAEMWGKYLSAARVEIATAMADAHRHLSAAYSNGDPQHHCYRFGSSESQLFGHSADSTDNPYCGPDWFVTIVHYGA